MQERSVTMGEMTAKLETDRLILRPFSRTDDEAMFCNWSNPDVVRYMALPEICHTIEDTKNRIDEWFQYFEKNANTWELFAIVLKSTGEVIGTIDYAETDIKSRSAEVGYQIGKAWWGLGYTTEALQAVIRHCFETVKLNRLWADCDIDNVSSVRVMQKAGMIREESSSSPNRVQYGIQR